LGSIPGEARADFRREVEVGKDELFALKRNLIDSERELEQFRKKHDLKRR